MSCTYNPYTLPTIDFVGGETQDLAFNVYFIEIKSRSVSLGVIAIFLSLVLQTKQEHPF